MPSRAHRASERDDSPSARAASPVLKSRSSGTAGLYVRTAAWSARMTRMADTTDMARLAYSDAMSDRRSGDLELCLASVMAECGDLPTRLVALHVDDGTGHCAGCAWRDRPRPVHPCTTRQTATRALHIQATRLAGRVLPIRPEPRRR